MTQSVTQLGLSATRPPRLGFLGVGWIGRHRLASVVWAQAAQVACIADPSDEARVEAARLTAGEPPVLVSSVDQLLSQDLDGVVIATPSAMHAVESITALKHGLAVFCQKPLARTAEATARVIDAARAADRLLAVDFSYRHTAAFQSILSLIRRGDLGDLYAIDLMFHNAYGPDKPWFKEPAFAGGGCVIDLGVHLIDLALCALGGRAGPITRVSSHLFAGGAPLEDPERKVEDYACAELTAASGVLIRLTCSWWLNAGQDAVIEAAFYGSKAGARLHNINGSFYDLGAELMQGTRRQVLTEPPDDWGGRAIIAWATRLARSPRYDSQIEALQPVAEVIDRIYHR